MGKFIKITISTFVFFCMSQSYADNPVQELKKSYVNGCVSRGLQRGGDAVGVANFCTCTWDALSQNLTVAEYVQLDALLSSNADPSGLEFWHRIEQKLQACKAKPVDEVKILMEKIEALNDQCRGGGVNDPEAACNEREKEMEKLETLGWCWGPKDAIGADKHWVKCQ